MTRRGLAIWVLIIIVMTMPSCQTVGSQLERVRQAQVAGQTVVVLRPQPGALAPAIWPLPNPASAADINAALGPGCQLAIERPDGQFRPLDLPQAAGPRAVDVALAAAESGWEVWLAGGGSAAAIAAGLVAGWRRYRGVQVQREQFAGAATAISAVLQAVKKKAEEKGNLPAAEVVDEIKGKLAELPVAQQRVIWDLYQEMKSREQLGTSMDRMDRIA